MRILYLITGLGMGGAEKVVAGLADAFAAKGHVVCIAYMTGSALVLPSNKNIRIIDLKIVSKLHTLGAFLKLRQLIKDYRPDVLHSHMVHANIFARIVRLTTPINLLISTAHSTNEGGKLRMLGYRLTDRLADISTNVSEGAVAAMIAAKATKLGRMIAVHNGIQTDTFYFNNDTRVQLRQALAIHEDTRLILAVGRLVDAKDYSNLLRAVSQLPLQTFKYQLCIAGDGQDRAYLEKLASDLGISDCVRFLGMRHDVADLMSAADVFVLSSAWEGFGLVVAEAMACERVVVATDCGGVREVLGRAGYLVKPKDSHALAQSLQVALQLTASQSAALGRAARQRVISMYSLNSVVKKWLRIYNETPKSKLKN